MYLWTGIIGFLAIFAPFLFGYNHNDVATWTSVLIGAALVVDSALEWIMKEDARWEYWVAGVVGVLAIVAPFVLGFFYITEAMLAMVLVGVVTIAVSWMGLRAEKPKLGF